MATSEQQESLSRVMGLKEADEKPHLYCSFCGKSQHDVKKLIAGPTVFICDECVDLCEDILNERPRDPRETNSVTFHLWMPHRDSLLWERMNIPASKLLEEALGVSLAGTEFENIDIGKLGDLLTAQALKILTDAKTSIEDLDADIESLQLAIETNEQHVLNARTYLDEDKARKGQLQILQERRQQLLSQQ